DAARRRAPIVRSRRRRHSRRAAPRASPSSHQANPPTTTKSEIRSTRYRERAKPETGEHPFHCRRSTAGPCGLLSDGRMPDYYARLIPHLNGPHRDLALRKQHLGLYDGLFVREAGKFLNGYDMAASEEIAPHVMLPIWSPPGSQRLDGGPFGAPCHAAEYTQGRQRCARAGR